MKALFISGDSEGVEVNTSRYRIHTPAKFLRAAGHEIDLQSNPGSGMKLYDRQVIAHRFLDFTRIPETVLIERNLTPGLIEKLRLAGARRIIATFDDHYSKLPSYAKAKPWWDDYYQEFLKALAMVDRVVVPSLRLADTYRDYAPDIRYLPNYIDDDDILSGPPEHDPKIIGWGGTGEHIESWRQKRFLNDLKRVLAENPDWKLRIIGPCGPALADILPKGVSFEWHNWVPFDQWRQALRRFTIGIAPLWGEYDRYRSNLKLVEYGLSGLPWVASLDDPYARTHVRGGVLVALTGWYGALSMLIKNESTRSTLAADGGAWAQSYRMSQHVAEYESVLWE